MIGFSSCTHRDREERQAMSIFSQSDQGNHSAFPWSDRFVHSSGCRSGRRHVLICEATVVVRSFGSLFVFSSAVVGSRPSFFQSTPKREREREIDDLDGFCAPSSLSMATLIGEEEETCLRIVKSKYDTNMHFRDQPQEAFVSKPTKTHQRSHRVP